VKKVISVVGLVLIVYLVIKGLGDELTVRTDTQVIEGKKITVSVKALCDYHGSDNGGDCTHQVSVSDGTELAPKFSFKAGKHVQFAKIGSSYFLLANRYGCCLNVSHRYIYNIATGTLAMKFVSEETETDRIIKVIRTKGKEFYFAVGVCGGDEIYRYNCEEIDPRLKDTQYFFVVSDGTETSTVLSLIDHRGSYAWSPKEWDVEVQKGSDQFDFELMLSHQKYSPDNIILRFKNRSFDEKQIEANPNFKFAQFVP
jgi:hypothetical protein